jgi:SHS2 domain-containing protein
MFKYTILDHTADIGIEVRGKSRKELFANVAAAMLDLMIEQKSSKKNINTSRAKAEPQEKTISVEGSNLEDLLINFLREVLYLFNGEHWIMKRCQLCELSNKRLVAELQGEPYNQKQQYIRTEIKAVTYHCLGISKTVEGWKARVIFDV